jgi:hypothetical protein
MPDILWLSQSAVLAKVCPNIATGCTHALNSEESKLTTQTNKIHICNFLQPGQKNLIHTLYKETMS